MYAAFDRFLQTDTWHTHHPSDEKRFFIALNEIVGRDDFNPDELGHHMKKKRGLADSPDGDPLAAAIDEYISQAWAVKDYLAAIESLDAIPITVLE